MGPEGLFPTQAEGSLHLFGKREGGQSGRGEEAGSQTLACVQDGRMAEKNLPE